MWYHIIDEYFDFPALNPAPLFSIEDNRISRYWKCHHEYDNTEHSDYFLLAFDEWVSDTYFFDSLIEGYEPATSIFNKYKELMDLEFPDKSQKDGLLLDADNWVMCPNCDEVWQVEKLNGLLRCSQCWSLLNNPFYPSS